MRDSILSDIASFDKRLLFFHTTIAGFESLPLTRAFNHRIENIPTPFKCQSEAVAMTGSSWLGRSVTWVLTLLIVVLCVVQISVAFDTKDKIQVNHSV